MGNKFGLIRTGKWLLGPRLQRRLDELYTAHMRETVFLSTIKPPLSIINANKSNNIFTTRVFIDQHDTTRGKIGVKNHQMEPQAFIKTCNGKQDKTQK